MCVYSADLKNTLTTFKLTSHGQSSTHFFTIMSRTLQHTDFRNSYEPRTTLGTGSAEGVHFTGKNYDETVQF